MIENILHSIDSQENNIIEIIGESGSGKSFILNKLTNSLDREKRPFNVYFSYVFKTNQLKEIIKIISEISDEKYNELIEQSLEFKFTNKYDFFYYLTDRLIAEDLLKSKIVLIYESRFLDQYTLDFIHYFIQSIGINIKIIIFSRSDKFPLSRQFRIDKPTKEEIALILKDIFQENKHDYRTESEIISNISDGNLFVIEYLLQNYSQQNKSIDFDSLINKKVNLDKIYNEKINDLQENQKKLLFEILLLDTKADLEIMTKVRKKEKFSKDLKLLFDEGLITEFFGNYYVKKVNIVLTLLQKLSKTEQGKILKPIIEVIDARRSAEILLSLPSQTIKIDNKFITYLTQIHDHYSLKNIYTKFLAQEKSIIKQAEYMTKLGLSNNQLNDSENATENFRNALSLSIENDLPADEIVYYLVENLLMSNSATFALEIIKKYSPKTQIPLWVWKLEILKTKILSELEQFKEALSCLDEAFRLTTSFEGQEDRTKMQARCRKEKGLIYYYMNDWHKAEIEFEEAEKLYNNSKNIEGLAAIFNNLGSLAMLQGDWKKTEVLFNKSLEYEKKRYSLNGISGCYSNLGYLYEGKGDYNKSLEYLNEALKIQKLLDDRDVIIKIYINIGVTYMDNGEYDKASDILNQLLEIVMKYNLYRSMIAALNNLGAVYFKSGAWTKAIDHYERAVGKSRENNFFEGLCQSYNNLGELYEKRGDYSLAYEFYSKSMELLPNFSDDFMKAEIYGNLGSVLTCLHKFSEAYRYIVESYEFFKSINASDKIIEGSQKQVMYFLYTRNYESANYYLDSALEIAEELEDEFQIGKCYYYKALLEKNDLEKARKSLKKAIEMFIRTKNNFELALANYEFAEILFDKSEWEQALQILNDNIKIVKKFGAIKFLEKNDILIQKINKKYAIELKESKHHESLLNKFYEITQNLNTISDFDTILETALDELIEFADADGGLFCLYNNQQVKDFWDYVILKNFSNEDKDYNNLLDLVRDTYDKNEIQNFKQPHFAPEYNNIIAFPLNVRNEKKGIICLFTKHDTHYFTEKMINLISALCNQIIIIVENISYSSLQKIHEIIREELATQSAFTNIIGKSERIQNIFQIIDKIKNTPTTILLEGPSGTGKELIARAIHFNSNRRNKKFIAQYCGALPETLLESELFGHVKGSFTGAIHDKKGLFEVANGGTFFLDEIGDISLSTQAKLLRFLQEGEIKKVGSTKTEKVDVRVICATNIPLKDSVENGTFRLDLFYRLNVIRIELPSLKERKSDIPLLAVHFLDKYNKKIDKKVSGITEEAMKYLSNYDWPGNIRQLENELERAVTLADNESYIKSSDLSEEIFKFQNITETIQMLENNSLKDAVEKLEKQMIIQILDETGWNQTQTAKKLGLSRQGLIKKIQRYELEK